MSRWADQYLADSQAPSLGLYLIPTPLDMDKATGFDVVRSSDSKHLFPGDGEQVRLFLRGYEAARQGERPYLLMVAGDVEPELWGPYGTDAQRLHAARVHRNECGDEDGLYRVDATGSVTVQPVRGRRTVSLSPATIEGLRASARKDIEAARLLDGAAVLVDSGWTQTADAVTRNGVKCAAESPRAVCWCLRGALLRACLQIGLTKLVATGQPALLAVDAKGEWTASVRGRAFRAAAVAVLGHEPSQLASLPAILTNWNDTTAMSGETVARRLRDAAARVRLRIETVQAGIRETEHAAAE